MNKEKIFQETFNEVLHVTRDNNGQITDAMIESIIAKRYENLTDDILESLKAAIRVGLEHEKKKYLNLMNSSDTTLKSETQTSSEETKSSEKINDPVEVAVIKKDHRELETIVDVVDFLRDYKNWSKTTSSGNRYKIYEVLVDKDGIPYINGAIELEKDYWAPYSWDCTGISRTAEGNDLTFNIKYKDGESIWTISNNKLIPCIFKEYKDHKFIIYEGIQSTSEIDIAIPWQIIKISFSNTK